MQNIGVAANFPIILTQLEINYSYIFLPHLIFFDLFFSILIYFILV